MGRYLLKRVLQLIPILIIISIIVFVMIRLSPGDPAVSIGGEKASAHTLELIRAKYNLNKPIYIQYFYWMKNLLHGDMGTSYKMSSPITKLILDRIPITGQMLAMALVFAIIISLPMGILAAVKRNRAVDHIISFLTVLSISAPVFFTGILLMLLFSVHLGWLPVYGEGQSFIENLKYLLLPSLALGINMVAMNARTLRSNMIEALNSNYIETAVAKGMSRRSIVLKHAFKNSLIPLVTISTVQIAAMIGNTSIIESTFNISGIGYLTVYGVSTTDYPLVQGCTLVIALTILLINLIVDCVCGLIDPRILMR